MSELIGVVLLEFLSSFLEFLGLLRQGLFGLFLGLEFLRSRGGLGLLCKLGLFFLQFLGLVGQGAGLLGGLFRRLLFGVRRLLGQLFLLFREALQLGDFFRLLLLVV